MIDVSKIKAEAVAQSKLVGCTCAVLGEVKGVPGRRRPSGAPGRRRPSSRVDVLADPAALGAVELMAGLDEIDVAKVSDCAGGCGTPVRRFASTPVTGTGLDGMPSGPWYCAACIQGRVVAALVAAGLREELT